MVEFIIKVNAQHTAYIPKELLNALGTEWGASHLGLVMIAYPKDTLTKHVLSSLKLLQNHYEMKLQLEKKVK